MSLSCTNAQREIGHGLGAEMLAEHHGFKVSRETPRKRIVEDGLWLSRKQRRTFHQTRLRRECYGELIQIDGSDHRWCEDRVLPCTLLVFIGNATSTLLELWFVKSDENYLLKHSRSVARATLFCLRDQRHVTKNLMLKSDRKRIKLEIKQLTRSLVGKFIGIDAYRCGRIQVRAAAWFYPTKL